MKRVLVVASTFPASETDDVPAFVRDQIIAMHDAEPNIQFSVLAPHGSRSHTTSYVRHDAFDEYRFHYVWPFFLEKLAGHGIMPALKANPLNFLLIPFLFFGEFIAVARLTRKLQPDLIYAHWFTPQAVVIRMVAFFFRTPLVFTTHASDVQVWSNIPIVGRLIVRSTTRRFQRFTAVSRQSMQKLAAFFTDDEWQKLAKRREVIPMGITLPLASSAALPQRSNKIVFIGRLAEKKGIKYLIDAVPHLLSLIPDLEVLIAGTGPELTALKQQVARLSLQDRIQFLGHVSGSDKEKLLNSAGVFVVPSIVTKSGDSEGLPVSLMEGLAYGNICIATPESGAGEIITDGQNGFIIPARDAKALAQALQKALSLDQTTQEHLRASAKETAKQFNWKVIARKHLDFLIMGLDYAKENSSR